jgi:hypothetical protein
MNPRRAFYDQTVRLERFYRSTLFLLDRAGELAIWSVVPKFRHRSRQNRDPTSVRPTLHQVKRYLFELVLIRLVAAMEAFLIDAVRSVSAVDKRPFMTRSRKHELTQDQLLEMPSIGQLHSLIIEKECRRLAGGGYPTISEFLANTLMVPLDSLSPGSNKLEYFFDTRNLLVHRLGATDDHYRRKYDVKSKFVEIDQEFVDDALDVSKHFGIALHRKLRSKYFEPKKRKRMA